jgi:hypothetical protein
MSIHPLTHATTEGPLGFPLTDRQAIALENILKALPRDETFRYRKALVARGASEVLSGERADVSWISTEDPDRVGEIVVARGMNDSQFKQNPIVTMQHAYWLPPVGKSLWRKVVKDGPLTGIKAKTQYPARPASWPGEKDWPADMAFALVQADLLRGKSIGFLPTKVHSPKSTEKQQNQWPDNTDLVIDEWILLEYACTFLPVQQAAVVEAVSKSNAYVSDDFVRAMGLDPETFRSLVAGQAEGGQTEPPHPQPLSPEAGARGAIERFTPLEEIEKALLRKIEAVKPQTLAETAAQAALDRARGRI